MIYEFPVPLNFRVLSSMHAFSLHVSKIRPIPDKAYSTFLVVINAFKDISKVSLEKFYIKIICKTGDLEFNCPF